MERHRCTTAGAAVIGAILLLGSGVWWLLALERDHREYWGEEDSAEIEAAEQAAQTWQQLPIAEEDREVVLSYLQTGQDGRPIVLSWSAEPLHNLARQGVKVLRVTYQSDEQSEPVEALFLVRKGKVMRLSARPSGTSVAQDGEGLPVSANARWEEELKELDRVIDFFRSMKFRE